MTNNSKPTDTINDWLLADQARCQEPKAFIDGTTSIEHYTSRGFSKIHRLLFGVERSKLGEYLHAAKADDIRREIDCPDNLGRTPLAWAAEYGLATHVRLLLAFGADPNQVRRNMHGFSPILHLAIAGPCSRWMGSAIEDTVFQLLDAGADPNMSDHEGWSPLHIAASWSTFNATELLENSGRIALNWKTRTIYDESILDVCDNEGYQRKYRGKLDLP